MTKQGKHIDGSNAVVNNILMIPEDGIGVLNLHLNGVGQPVLLNLTENQINQINKVLAE